MPCAIENFKEISEKFQSLLNLTKSPVAVKLFFDEEDAAEVLPKAEDKIRHCQRIFKAANDKVSCYATLEEQQCQGGAAVLGLRDWPEALETGKKYYSLGRFASRGSGIHELDQVPKVEVPIKAVGYAPLEDAKFEADVIVMYAIPEQAMRIAQANGYVLGKRFNANFAGIQSMCADVVAGPYINKEPNMSMGCDGSRGTTSVSPDELIVGLTAENLGCTLNSLESIIGDKK